MCTTHVYFRPVFVKPAVGYMMLYGDGKIRQEKESKSNIKLVTNCTNCVMYLI